MIDQRHPLYDLALAQLSLPRDPRAERELLDRVLEAVKASDADRPERREVPVAV